MAASKNLTPAQRRLRAQKAANTRWANEPDRLRATAPGLRAIFQRFLDEVDPDHLLPEKQRIKMAENARKAHLADIQLKASKATQAHKQATSEETSHRMGGGA